MKKLAAVLAITAAFATPAFSQTMYNWNTGEYVESPRTQSQFYIHGGTPGVNTQRGVMTDPDPFVRNQIRQNYNYYQNLNGG